MNKKKFKMKNLNWLIVLSVLFSCTTVNNINKPVTPTPSVTSAQSVLPTVNPTVSNSNTASPVPSSSSTITPSPVPIVTGTPTTDISEMATLNGKVYDQSGTFLNDIKVSIKSLEPDFQLSQETTTSNGSYIFRNIPVGIRLQVDAFKSDTWTKKSQSIILKSNLSGLFNQNVLDFGDSYNNEDIRKTNLYFLTDAPEVTSITPKRNTSIKNTGISFKMTFSELVDKDSVEDNFVIRYISSGISSSTAPGDGTKGTENTDGPPSLLGNDQVIILKNSIDGSFNWDVNQGDFGREVTYTIGENRALPVSNKNPALYSISLRELAGDVRIKDAEGNNGLTNGEFFVDDVRAKNIVFSVQADKSNPYLESIKLDKTSTDCIIRLVFSEPMTTQIVDNPDLRDISFYKFFKNNNQIELEEPRFSSNNPRSLEIFTTDDTFAENDLIRVEVDPNLKDPSGNFFSEGVTLDERDNIKELRYKP